MPWAVFTIVLSIRMKIESDKPCLEHHRLSSFLITQERKMNDQNLSTLCTPPPSGLPDGVRPNCFTNLERLGRWTGGTTVIESGQSPASYFEPVAAQSIGGASVHLYVVVHGWAPGLRDLVNQHGGNLQWWSSDANPGGVWESEWAWTPTQGTDPALQVKATGLIQEILLYDTNAVVLAYSWIDDSATPAIDWEDPDALNDVYLSEAYTNINGLRLADAITQAVSEDSWKNAAIHLIGHSHGSKVVTTAALALQMGGNPIHHLTICDSPESDATLIANGANLLGFYLNKLDTSATFVDNYVSYFGTAYTGSAAIDNVVDVILDPGEIYGITDVSDKHAYSAAWYGGAAAAAKQFTLNPLGLDWPPPPTSHTPALIQQWSQVTEQEQWPLAAGTADPSLNFSDTPLTVYTVSQSSTVKGTPATGLTFNAAANGTVVRSQFEGKFNADVTDLYGIAFEVLWTNPTDGDHLVVTVTSPIAREQEVILVMDGKSKIEGSHWVSFNTNNTEAALSDTFFIIHYIPAETNTGGAVAISSFRSIIVA